MVSKNKVLLDDKSRFVEVIKLLPEKFVNDLRDYLFEAHFPVRYNEVFSKYFNRSDEFLLTFSTSKINKAYQKVETFFSNLIDFLNSNFDIPKGYHLNPLYRELRPEISHRFGKHDAESQKKWDKYKRDLDVLVETFVDAYGDFIHIARKEVERENAIAEPSTKKDSKTIPVTLYLNTTGDLWREPKEKFCYPIKEKSDRHKIVRYLATHKGIQQTLDMSNEFEGKPLQSIRTEIGKIRGEIKKFLKIDGKRVIEEGKTGSGYMIGRGCKIKIVR
ncbi:MAG: hypothetical protein KGI50_00210 [Patescibacteria group bacterium]|nr:hypothetical protein [Patescibacteria group bacterium]MDE2438215.1 hypothetical protein [Patescibacteria group bacterium]